MTASWGNLILWLVLLPGLSGCLGSLASSSIPPRYFQFDYPYHSLSCSQSADEGVKIWPLTASSPYDRENMIVLDPSRLVQFSPQFRWVALPGSMITDMLLRDFTRGALFTTAVPAGNPFDVSLELGGHVFEFAREQDGALGRAVLDVEISLWREAPKRRVLFRQHYHFESNPGTTNDSQAFAREMSELVGRLSAQLSRDLFATIQKGSLSPDAG